MTCGILCVMRRERRGVLHRDKSSQPKINRGEGGGGGGGDSCHGRVSGINKICFLCSFYCRSQATAA